MANTYKKGKSEVKRGMVFWYNLDEQVNKNSNPTITVDGETFHDFRQYGDRHWLVVSNNEGNNSSPTCNVVAITSSDNKAHIPTHVPIVYRGKPYEILCETTMTVNAVSLAEYAYRVSDSVMEQVERALSIQFCIRKKYSIPSAAVNTLMRHIEIRADEVLNALFTRMEERVETMLFTVMQKYEESKKAAPQPTHKAEDGAKETKQFRHVAGSAAAYPKKMERPSSKTAINSRMSQIDKFNARYPDLGSNTAQPLTDAARRNKWTAEDMRDYLADCSAFSPLQVMEKWGLKNVKTVYSMKYYILNKQAKLLEAK